MDLLKKLIFATFFVPFVIAGAGFEAGKESLKEKCDLCDEPRNEVLGSGLLCSRHYSLIK